MKKDKNVSELLSSSESNENMWEGYTVSEEPVYTFDGEGKLQQIYPERQENNNRETEIKNLFGDVVEVDDKLLKYAMDLAKAGKAEELKAFLTEHKGEFDIHGKDSKGRNLAHYAAMSDSVETLEVVEDAGIDLKSKDNDGNTIAHTACSSGDHWLDIAMNGQNVPSVEMLQSMSRYGIDLTAENEDGKTALDILAPVNEEGKRILPPGKCIGHAGIVRGPSGGLCGGYSIFEKNEKAEDAAHYLAKKEGDDKPIEHHSNKCPSQLLQAQNLNQETLLAKNMNVDSLNNLLKSHGKNISTEDDNRLINNDLNIIKETKNIRD